MLIGSSREQVGFDDTLPGRGAQPRWRGARWRCSRSWRGPSVMRSYLRLPPVHARPPAGDRPRPRRCRAVVRDRATRAPASGWPRRPATCSPRSCSGSRPRWTRARTPSTGRRSWRPGPWSRGPWRPDHDLVPRPSERDPPEPGPDRPLTILVDGEPVTGTAGRRSPGCCWRRTARSGAPPATGGAPRGVFCGIGVCFDCLVEVNGLRDVRACLRRAQDGDVVTRQDGPPAGIDERRA